MKIATSLINNNEKNSICVFQAPTGSGKTVMIGQLIRELIDENTDTDLCFLWVSIGKGQLHVQSKNKLENMFEGSPICSLIEEEFVGFREEINQNEVVFVNWEKVRSKNRSTNEWSNTLMRSGDKISFPEVLENTTSKRKIILIMDESHYGADTDRAKEIKSLINADLLLHMSATPSYIPDARQIQLGTAGYVSVEPSQVIEEGMIKKK
ncbi:DEAD/DEAH box helicase family protein [Salinicoccus sp. HZC-1]|uniref:DEAD/DEAH box helicase family protein n=1 Tax=Salinicoccus sp. HZC-1 TaxID=3385497 RepID=UPI00398B4861